MLEDSHRLCQPLVPDNSIALQELDHLNHKSVSDEDDL
jgi:hypothetical protein